MESITPTPISISNNWSISRPTIINLSQVQYRLSSIPAPNGIPDGFVLVECINLHETALVPAAWKPWRIFPAAYKALLPRILHRLETLCDVYDAIKDNKPYQRAHVDAFRVLRLYIVHTERTLERLWEEVYQSARARKMNADWRSPTFDGWLLVEHELRCHIAIPSEEYTRRTGVSWAELMGKDPLKFNWEAFDEECPAWQRNDPPYLDSDEAVREVLAWCEPQAKKLVEQSDANAASPNKRKSESASQKPVKKLPSFKKNTEIKEEEPVSTTKISKSSASPKKL